MRLLPVVATALALGLSPIGLRAQAPAKAAPAPSTVRRG